jgi:hypothetical protein
VSQTLTVESPGFAPPSQPTGELLLKPINHGQPVRLTPEIVSNVADDVASGLPLKLALASQPQYLTEENWNKEIAKNTKLRLLFEQKIAHWVKARLKSIDGCNSKELPVGSCWILERRLPEYFALNKGSQVNVQVNVAGLAEDVVRRASSFVKRKAASQAPIEVSAKVSRPRKAKHP